MSRRSVQHSLGTLSIALLLALAGCGDKERNAPAPEAAQPAPEPAAAPAAAAPAPAEAASGGVERGAQHYVALCASCHGARGDAETPIAVSLIPRPVRHNDGNYMNGLSDEHLFRVIKEGGAAVGKSPLMAAWGGALTDAQIRDVVAFIRTLADPPYSPPAG
ncbi:MAG TPA: cytochrome c [Myxococcota bacterium]